MPCQPPVLLGHPSQVRQCQSPKPTTTELSVPRSPILNSKQEELDPKLQDVRLSSAEYRALKARRRAERFGSTTKPPQSEIPATLQPATQIHEARKARRVLQKQRPVIASSLNEKSPRRDKPARSEQRVSPSSAPPASKLSLAPRLISHIRATKHTLLRILCGTSSSTPPSPLTGTSPTPPSHSPPALEQFSDPRPPSITPSLTSYIQHTRSPSPQLHTATCVPIGIYAPERHYFCTGTQRMRVVGRAVGNGCECLACEEDRWGGVRVRV